MSTADLALFLDLTLVHVMVAKVKELHPAVNLFTLSDIRVHYFVTIVSVLKHA